MATTVASLLARATTLLQDPTHVRWAETEMLDWLNDGQKEALAYKPNVYLVRAVVTLVAGTKQTLPLDAVQLSDIPRNYSDALTPGAQVQLVTREILDSFTPNWHAALKTTLVKHYTYTPTEPKTFYVSPPNSGTGKIELVYSATPPTATLIGVIALDDIYGPALVDYIMYRAYSKDAEFAGAMQLATGYYQAFAGKLQGRAAAEGATA